MMFTEQVQDCTKRNCTLKIVAGAFRGQEPVILKVHAACKESLQRGLLSRSSVTNGWKCKAMLACLSKFRCSSISTRVKWLLVFFFFFFVLFWFRTHKPVIAKVYHKSYYCVLYCAGVPAHQRIYVFLFLRRSLSMPISYFCTFGRRCSLYQIGFILH